MTRSQRIGRLILANCDAYHAGTRTYEQWDAEQRRLWDMAKRYRCQRAVCRVVLPN